MKKIILCTFLLLISFTYSNGQKVSYSSKKNVRVTLTDGSALYGKILEQSGSIIKFKESPTGSIDLLDSWQQIDTSFDLDAGLPVSNNFEFSNPAFTNGFQNYGGSYQSNEPPENYDNCQKPERKCK